MLAHPKPTSRADRPWGRERLVDTVMSSRSTRELAALVLAAGHPGCLCYGASPNGTSVIVATTSVGARYGMPPALCPRATDVWERYVDSSVVRFWSGCASGGGVRLCRAVIAARARLIRTCGRLCVVIDVPEIHYAKSGRHHIAYQVTGGGPVDLLFVQSFVSNIEIMWEDPSLARFLRRLATFSRLVLFDGRGSGLSDPVGIDAVPTLDERVEDALAVLDAVGIERAAVFGTNGGGQTAIYLAAAHLERVSALVTYNAWASALQDRNADRVAEIVRRAERIWGGHEALGAIDSPSGADRRDWVLRFYRLSVSPGMAVAAQRADLERSVVPFLGAVQAPALVLQREGSRTVEEAHLLADRLPRARLRLLAGEGQVWFIDDTDPVLDEIEEFLTGHRTAAEGHVIVSTVLFTDIVASTEQTAAAGDRAWGKVSDEHDAIVRRALHRHRGREIKTMGDAFLATFDGATRAIRCATEIVLGAGNIGLEVRAGIHTGEVEVRDGDVAGLAVTIGKRICDLAGPGQVLVSETVKGLVAGSGMSLSDQGTHSLKGVPDEWRLFAVEGERTRRTSASEPIGRGRADSA